MTNYNNPWKDFDYKPLFQTLKKHVLDAKWNYDEGLIYLRSGFVVRCTFSYNEPKIYFWLGERYWRALGTGQEAAESLLRVEEKLKAVAEVINKEY
jgi:hypothetical protein